MVENSTPRAFFLEEEEEASFLPVPAPRHFDLPTPRHPTMPMPLSNWKVWPAAPPGGKKKATPLTLHLFVDELSGLPLEGLRWSPTGEIAVVVEWRGARRRAGVLLLPPSRSSTSRRHARPDGVVSWEEGLSHTCKLKIQNDLIEIRKSWIIQLEIHGFGFRSYSTSSALIGKAQIDAAAYAHTKGKTLRIPISCDVNGSVAIGGLMLTMEFLETGKEKKPKWSMSRAFTFNIKQRRSFTEESSGEESTATTQMEIPRERAAGRSRRFSSLSFNRPRLLRGLSWMRKQEPAGDAAAGVVEEWRDVGRTSSLRVLMEREPEEVVVLEDEGDVGRWERRSVVSRDGGVEMVTEVFFASIDQCSEKAAGEGACAVLVTLIADWLHRNKGTLPLRQELDEMIRLGSSEWRALCHESTHRRRFSDRHFDLETVLSAKLRPLTVVTSLSYVGFFSLDVDGLEYLDHAMSFDTVFEELLLANASTSYSEEHVYIASWNDHFFVLKVTSDAIYLIDTLGERLHEGCNQAYIIKFGDESVIRQLPIFDDGSGASPAMLVSGVEEEVVVVCEGIGSCKEYMKRFLAAVPLREMRSEIERGAASLADVHRRLQIEFHYTVLASPIP